MKDQVITGPEALAVRQRGFNRSLLVVWTVTQNPSDYPGKFVARPSYIGRGTITPLHTVLVADTLDDLHTMMPPALVRMPRDQNDDAVIVEVWI